ncbi:hypothetical protein, partial [Dermacoccus nishinomiyaensis]|uniref:hypothetical protein n=1 Tax=Dermacoccus nishinomiyaensis TaxID=1274 RepID=UPI0033A06A2F
FVVDGFGAAFVVDGFGAAFVVDGFGAAFVVDGFGAAFVVDGVEVADFVGVELEEIEGTSDAVFESLEPQAASVEAAATAAAAAIVREVVRVVENVIMLRCRRSLTGGAQSTEGSVRSARLRPALQPVDHGVEGTSV